VPKDESTELEPEEESLPERLHQDQQALPALIPFQGPGAEIAEPEPPVPQIIAPPSPAAATPKSDPQPRLIVPKKKPAVLKESKPDKVHVKQEMMQFEPVSRGRFEKSEPTIVEGQDLDVPTFLRKNIRVK
jgi:cell division protein FtsZ